MILISYKIFIYWKSDKSFNTLHLNNKFNSKGLPSEKLKIAGSTLENTSFSIEYSFSTEVLNGKRDTIECLDFPVSSLHSSSRRISLVPNSAIFYFQDSQKYFQLIVGCNLWDKRCSS